MKKNKFYMAIDQYGETLHGLKHPRKDIAERVGVTPGALQKVCMDGKDGVTYHVGYVASGRWFEVFEVIPMRRKEE